MATPENVRKAQDADRRHKVAAGTATPVWRRVTAFFGLAFFSVAGGAALAAAIAALTLLALLVIERAIAG